MKKKWEEKNTYLCRKKNKEKETAKNTQKERKYILEFEYEKNFLIL